MDWLNEAQLAPDNEKIELLHKVSEIVVNKEPELLKEFLDHILAFHADRNSEIRKCIISFVEQTG